MEFLLCPHASSVLQQLLEMRKVIDEFCQVLLRAIVDVVRDLESFKDLKSLESGLKLWCEDSNEVVDGELLKVNENGLRDNRSVCGRRYVYKAFGKSKFLFVQDFFVFLFRFFGPLLMDKIDSRLM